MEVIETVEKESKSMKDINALIQTMHLKKFKVVNNKFIEKKRTAYRKVIYKKMKTPKVAFKSQTENREKYLQRLVLYNNNHCPDHKTLKENLDLLVCNTDWPVCVYDHCYKNQCRSYFAFRCGYDLRIIEDYFDIDSLSFNKVRPHSKSSFDSTMPYEDTKSHLYNSLLIERNPHYCQNKKFVMKIKELLRQDECEWAFEDLCILSKVNDEVSLLNSMDNYVEFITESGEIEDFTKQKERHNDYVELSSKKEIKASKTKSSELILNTHSTKKGKFRLGMYLSTISFQKCSNSSKKL